MTLPPGGTRRLVYPNARTADALVVLEARGREPRLSDRLHSLGSSSTSPEREPLW
jgi:hypothetical protein